MFIFNSSASEERDPPKAHVQTQADDILRHLQSGRPITPLEALEKYGCFRLGGRIYDLKKLGHKIKTDMVQQNGKRFASYSLER